MQTLTRAAAALASFAVLTLGVAGCGDDDGNRPQPAATPLDPQAVAASMAKLDDILDQPALEALFLVPGSFPTGAAAAAARPGRSSAAALALPGPAARLADALGTPILLDRGIAPEYRGKTYLYDVTRHQWRLDATRGGAPANGVRFVMGPTIGSPSTPVVGSVDVEDRASATEARIVATLRNPAGVTVMTYDDRSTGEPFMPGFTQSIQGRVTKGSEELTFAWVVSVTGGGATGTTERATFSWALPSASLSMESGFFARDAAGDSSYSVMQLGGRTIRTVNRYVRDAEFSGYIPSDTTSLFLDDRLYVYMIFPADAESEAELRIVRPNGSALPADEQATLMRRDTSMVGVGMLLFTPIIIEGWVYGLGLA
jgi:hypothetical protein